MFDFRGRFDKKCLEANAECIKDIYLLISEQSIIHSYPWQFIEGSYPSWRRVRVTLLFQRTALLCLLHLHIIRNLYLIPTIDLLCRHIPIPLIWLPMAAMLLFLPLRNIRNWYFPLSLLLSLRFSSPHANKYSNHDY
jgi:hypothetical protein